MPGVPNKSCLPIPWVATGQLFQSVMSEPFMIGAGIGALRMPIRICGYYGKAGKRRASWWNGQTHRLEGAAGQPIRVRISPSAPESLPFEPAPLPSGKTKDAGHGSVVWSVLKTNYPTIPT